MALKVLGVGSSMREGSHGTRALKIVLERMEKLQAETHLLDLRKVKMPTFNPNSSVQSSKRIREVTKEVNWADVFILATPDYHGSMSGPIKNFLDHYWQEFAGKTFGYLCTSHEKGLTVMDQMRTAVRQCYGWSLPYGISINPEEDFDDKRKVINRKLSSRLDMLARDLVVYGKLIRKQFVNDLLQSAPVNTFAAYYKK